MKLKDYMNTKWGPFVLALIFVNEITIIIFSFISYMILLEFPNTQLFFILSIVSAISGLILIVLPLIVNIKKILFEILAFIVGIGVLLIAILSFVPYFHFGWSFFTIFQFALGIPLLIFTSLNITNYSRE